MFLQKFLYLQLNKTKLNMRKFLSLFIVLILTGVLAFAQTRVVTGKVTDNTGAPVEGATIKVKGSKKGVAADVNGNYSISVNPGAVLMISGVGINTQEIAVGSDNNVNVNVVRNNTELTNVVVTAYGIKRQAKQLGYSTAKVSTEELNQAKVTNIANGLAAKVSGLSINLINNGVKPDVRITLRGNRSILGNNQALLVVDDIQVPINYINSISPNDVDNVSILKGASASALYGSAASNGVIIVTTKKGTKGKPQVRFSSTTTIEDIAYTAKFQNEFGQFGGEFPDQYAGVITLNGRPKFIPGQYQWLDNIYVPYENQNYGGRFNGQRVPIGPPIRVYKADGSYTIQQDSITYSAIPNAKRKFFDKGVQYVNSLSYSSGDDKGLFYLSFEDLNTKGVIPKDVNRRNTIRVNGSRTNGIFSAAYNIGYSLTHTNTTPGSGVPFTSLGGGGGYNGGGSYFQSRPLYWTIINQPADVDLRKYRDWQHNPFASPDGYFNAYYGNPWWQIDQTRLDEQSNDILANVALNLKPTSWLNFTYKASIARNDYNNKYTQAGYTFAPWAIADTLGSGNIPSGVKKLSPSSGNTTTFSQRLESDFLASVHKGFGDFDATLILGTSYIDAKTSYTSLSANALVIPDFYNISNRIGQPNVGQFITHRRTLGVFGDLTLGYKNYLFLHGSLRNDWTSLLSTKNRSYLYPAVDAAFVFTDAIPTLKDNKILNYGKLRLAYSQTAQVSIGPYALQNTFNNGPGFPYGNTAGFSVNGEFANPDIKPELSKEEEIGLELSFFKNRIIFSTAIYNTVTTNQTIPIDISRATGFSRAFVNSGEMSNKGYEFDLKVTPVQTKNFRWEVGATYAYNKNILESLGFGLKEVSLGGSAYAIIGQPYPTIKTSDWQRDPQGRIIVDTKTGYPTLDQNPRVFGTSNPPTKIGLNTKFEYKGFTLSAVADGRFGAVIYNALGSDLDFTGVSAYSTSSGRQPFVIPNSSYVDPANPKGYIANTKYNTQDGNIQFWASLWNTAGGNYVNSADFWKLRELSLGYTFPQSTFSHLRAVKGLSLSLQGRNLLAFRAKDNVWSDPEFSNTIGNAFGVTDINQLPPTRFYGFNITVTF